MIDITIRSVLPQRKGKIYLYPFQKEQSTKEKENECIESKVSFEAIATQTNASIIPRFDMNVTTSKDMESTKESSIDKDKCKNMGKNNISKLYKK